MKVSIHPEKDMLHGGSTRYVGKNFIFKENSNMYLGWKYVEDTSYSFENI